MGAYRNLVLEQLEKEIEEWLRSDSYPAETFLCIIVRSDCDMFNSDPSRLQDQGSDRTKLKQIGMKTTSTAIGMVSITPDMTRASVHVCVWSTELHRELFKKALFSEICNVQCIRGTGSSVTCGISLKIE